MRAFTLIGGGAASDGSAVTAPASSHTKGAWTSIGTSPAFRTCGAVLNVNLAGTDDGFVDIGLGATPSDRIVVSNAFVSRFASTTTGRVVRFDLPRLAIPPNTDISARYQRRSTALTINCSMILFAAQPSDIPIHRVSAVGLDTATSRGVDVDAGGTANTLIPWVTLGSLPHAAAWLLPVVGGQGNSARSEANFRVEIGLGATPQLAIPGLMTTTSTALDMPEPQSLGTFPVEAPSGVTVSARMSSNIIDTADRKLDVAVLVGG